MNQIEKHLENKGFFRKESNWLWFYPQNELSFNDISVLNSTGFNYSKKRKAYYHTGENNMTDKKFKIDIKDLKKQYENMFFESANIFKKNIIDGFNGGCAVFYLIVNNGKSKFVCDFKKLSVKINDSWVFKGKFITVKLTKSYSSGYILKIEGIESYSNGNANQFQKGYDSVAEYIRKYYKDNMNSDISIDIRVNID